MTLLTAGTNYNFKRTTKWHLAKIVGSDPIHFEVHAACKDAHAGRMLNVQRDVDALQKDMCPHCKKIMEDKNEH